MAYDVSCIASAWVMAVGSKATALMWSFKNCTELVKLPSLKFKLAEKLGSEILVF
jgi:hypothetical protein